VSLARSTTRGTVGLVTSAGRVLRVGVLDLPAVPAVTTGALSLRGGAPATEFAALQRGERILALSSLPDDGPGIALATRQGTVKRVAPEWPAKGEAVEIVALRPGDEVVGAAELASGEEELVLFASSGDLLRFPASAVRPQGRSAGGMAGMKLAAGAVLVGFSAVDLRPPEGVLDVVDEPLVVNEWPNKGEAVDIVALRPGDEVVGAAELVDGEEELVLFSSTGDLLRFPASTVGHRAARPAGWPDQAGPGCLRRGASAPSRWPRPRGCWTWSTSLSSSPAAGCRRRAAAGVPVWCPP
jgi:DNA gyrase/topoisomerase IV subunit A